MKKEQTNIMLAPETRRSLKVKAAQLGSTMSAIISGLIELWLIGDIDIPKIEDGNKEDGDAVS